MITDGSHPSHMDPDPAQTPSSTALQSTTQQPWVCPSLEPRRSTIAADGEPLDVVGAAPYEPAPEDEEPPPVQAAAIKASAARPATDHPRRTKRGLLDGRCPAERVGRS